MKTPSSTAESPEQLAERLRSLIAEAAAIPVALLVGRRFRVARWFGPLLRMAPLARSRRAAASGRPA